MAPANQTKKRSVEGTFRSCIPEQKFNVNRACFPKEKHQNSQKRVRFMNFSFWPCLPGRLLIKGAGDLVLCRKVFEECRRVDAAMSRWGRLLQNFSGHVHSYCLQQRGTCDALHHGLNLAATQNMAHELVPPYPFPYYLGKGSCFRLHRQGRSGHHHRSHHEKDCPHLIISQRRGRFTSRPRTGL